MNCPACGKKISTSSNERFFICPDCGFDFRKYIVAGKIRRFFSFLLDFFFIFFPIATYRFMTYFLEKVLRYFYIIENRHYGYDVFSFPHTFWYYSGYISYGTSAFSLFKYTGILTFFIFLLFVAFDIYLIIVKKSSYGKKLLGIRVSYLSLSLPKKLDMFLRFILGLLLIPLSFFTIIFTKYSQGIEDKVFSTILVEERKLKRLYGDFFNE